MKMLIEYFVRFRNPAFCFDKELSSRDVLCFSFIQLKALFRGCRTLLFGRNPRGMMLGKNVSMLFMRKIIWGRFLKLGDAVTLNALGKKGITLGNNVGIGAFGRLIVSAAFNNIGSYINIGNNVGIGEYAYLGGAGGLTIGDDCIVGQYFSCHPENHCCSNLDIPIRFQGVSRAGISIGNNCWIGSKVTILDGVTIGDGCVIGAGAVVTKSFPPGCVIGGVPARILRMRDTNTLTEAAA